MSGRGIGVLVLSLTGLAWLFHGASARGLAAAQWSSYRSAADGTRALFLTLEELGWAVERRHRDLAVVDDRPDLLISIAPEGLDDDEFEGVAAMLAAGTPLLLIAEESVEVPGALWFDAKPEAVTNGQLRRGDTARQLVRMISALVPPGGRIQFDEHHHGLTSERGIAAYVADRGLAPLALQLVLVAWFLLWTMRRRRAALKTARDETLTGPIDSDLIAAMAEAYRRGRAVDHAAERLMAELRADLAGLRAPDIGLKKTAEDLEVRLLKLRASRPRESALLAFAQRVVKTQESIHERR